MSFVLFLLQAQEYAQCNYPKILVNIFILALVDKIFRDWSWKCVFLISISSDYFVPISSAYSGLEF